MKKKLIVLLGILFVLVLSSLFLVAFVKQNENSEEEFTIVTSFYPMYVVTENIAGDIPGVEVKNLTEQTSGCLHDYQLTTSDMKKLEGADLLVINGGGMESFIQDIVNTYPELNVVNASEGIEFLKSEEHQHGHGHEEPEENEETEELDHNHEQETNAHVWLNMNHYMQQIQTVQDSLAKFDAQNANRYQSNGDAYQKDILNLKEEMEHTLKGIEESKIIIFHDSFAYLAQEFGLEVVHAVNLDSESSFSAGEIAEVIDEVIEEQVTVLFTEEQFSTTIADSVSKETGAKVYVLDSIVSGDMAKDAYINAMKKNLEILKEALMKQ